MDQEHLNRKHYHETNEVECSEVNEEKTDGSDYHHMSINLSRFSCF